MKANEAPEKVYLQENTTTDCYGEFWPEWFEARAKDSDIEYIRKDAFIEKACEWFRRIDYDDTISPYETTEEFIKVFKNAMQGE